MRVHIYLIIIGSVFLFASCERVVEVDYKKMNLKEKIVIQGYLSEDDTYAYIFKSLPLNNIKESNYLSSPNIWLYKNGTAHVQFFEIDSCLYQLNDTIRLDQNAIYNIVVEAEGFEKAISNTDKIIKKVAIDTLYKNFDSTQWAGFLYVHFTDNNLEYNKYLISISTYRKNDPEFKYVYGGTLTDDGYDINTRIYCDNYVYNFDSAVVKVTTVSDVLIEFENSYSDYEVSYGSYSYETFFPVDNYIMNGYGFFGAQETTTYIYNEKN